MVEQTELNRLFWHSRRGMLELDVLLVPFVQEVYPSLDAEDQARYRKLLECEDQDMFGWFMPEPEYCLFNQRRLRSQRLRRKSLLPRKQCLQKFQNIHLQQPGNRKLKLFQFSKPSTAKHLRKQPNLQQRKLRRL